MPYRSNDVAYAAGLYEGEGCVYSQLGKATVRGKKYDRKTPQHFIRIAMTDREPLDRFAALFGGKVYGPYKRGAEHHKPLYSYNLHGFERVQAAVAAMWGWLSPRRQEQARLVFTAPQGNPRCRGGG